VIGLMIKLMAKVSIYMQMAQDMLELGKKISNMEMELKCGQMEQDLKAII
jgi:hypothetical protein